jgi:SAM-dependent methyltransferase
MREKVGAEWFREYPPGQVMNERMRLMTKAMDEEALNKPLAANKFYFESYNTMYHLVKALEPHGFNFKTAGAIMEFGCGSARLLRLFRCIEGIRLVGADANPACIEWCRENVPDIEYHQNQLRPPLTWAQDKSLNLIFSVSVFNHIPEELQQAWLHELFRVLRPGGFFLCTVHGRVVRELQLSAEARDQFRRNGLVTLTGDDPRASLSTRSINSWDVHQTRERIIGIFGSVFQFVDYIPDVDNPIGQDILVLKKSEWCR